MLIGNNVIRDDVLDEGLDEKMAPSLGGVVLGKEHEIYVNAKEFFKRTLITENMLNVLEKIASVISGKGGTKILVLSALFGGGKTHTLITILHALRDPEALRLARAENESVGKRLENLARLLEELKVRGVDIAIIDGSFAELAPSPTIGELNAGRYTVRTLWGYLAHVLGNYDALRLHDEKLTPPDTGTLLNLMSNKRVVLLVDEIAQYIKRFYESGDSRLRAYASALSTFIEALAKAVEMANTVSLVISLPGEKVRDEVKVDQAYLAINGLIKNIFRALDRVGVYYVEPVAPRDVPALLKTRLFERIDTSTARHVSDRLYKAYTDNEDVFGKVKPDLTYKILEDYPFHPEYVSTLLDILDKHPGLQKTRDLLKISRKVLRNVIHDSKRYALIMPWHLDVTRDPLRSVLLTGDYESFKSVVDVDIVERCKNYEKPWPASVAALALFARTFAYGGGIVPRPEAYPTPSELAMAVYEPYSFDEAELAPKDVAEAISWISQNLVYVARDERTDRLWFTRFITPIKHVEDRAKMVDDVTAINRVAEEARSLLTTPLEVLLKRRKRAEALSGLFSTKRSMVQQRCDPVDIDDDDKEYFVLVCLETPSIDELERVIYETRSGGKRRYANTAYVVYPSSGESLRNVMVLAKRYIACEEIEKELDNLVASFSEKERDIAKEVMQRKLREYGQTVHEDLLKNILHALDTVAYPAYDSKEARNTVKRERYENIETILSSVETALSRPGVGKVKREFDYDLLNKYLEKIGINLEGGPRKAGNIVDYFYSNPALPAVSKNLIFEALVNGIRNLNIGAKCGDQVYFKKVIDCGEQRDCLDKLPERTEGDTTLSKRIDEECVILPWREALVEQMQQLKRREVTEKDALVLIDYALKIDRDLVPVEKVLQNLDKYDLEKLRLAPLTRFKKRVTVKIDLHPAEVEARPEDDIKVEVVLSSVGPFEGEAVLEPSSGQVDRPTIYVKPGALEKVTWSLKAPSRSGDHSFDLTVKDSAGRILGSSTLAIRVKREALPIPTPTWTKGVPPPGTKVSSLRVELEKLNVKPLSTLKNRLGGDAIVAEGLLSLSIRDITGRTSSVKLEVTNVTLDECLTLMTTAIRRFEHFERGETSAHIRAILKPANKKTLTFPELAEAERGELKECLEYLPAE